MEKKKYAWLNPKPNSAKTLIEIAKNKVPFFKEHYSKFEEQMTIGGYSQSTLFNYSGGLRVGEVCRLKISDIDKDRMQIRVVKSKGNHDRYVPLSNLVMIGLDKYLRSSLPVTYLFNGRIKGGPLGHSAVQQSFRLALKQANILKDASAVTHK